MLAALATHPQHVVALGVAEVSDVGLGDCAGGPARERLRDVIGLFSDYVEVGEHLLARSRRRDT
ncbi:hypothetical protein AB0K40_34025 [Nonomuraea bangladeshensis]|uniref:Uncharacterized protein n=1 Tax=Nonomuraea bangladeshensis TaxID=404385 RepID=A0ABV3HDG8_9ACTN